MFVITNMYNNTKSLHIDWGGGVEIQNHHHLSNTMQIRQALWHPWGLVLHK